MLLLALVYTKMGPSKVGDVIRHMVLGLTLSRLPWGVASRTCLTNLSWGILITESSWWSSLLQTKVDQHSGLFQFHHCTLCREVSRRESFKKIIS